MSIVISEYIELCHVSQGRRLEMGIGRAFSGLFINLYYDVSYLKFGGT